MTTASQQAPAAEVAGLAIRTGKGSPILDGIDFVLAPGAITGLLGPSGAGKTTLMRTLVGVHKISSGTVKVFGLAAGAPALRGAVGYVTQAPSVYQDLSVLENVRYFAALQGLPRASALEAIDAVGLSPLSHRRASGLSGGEFSRVSLACALAGKPRLLVLDEPTVGLDPVLRAELWQRFAALAQEGTSLLISSHVMEEASHCQTLLLLRQGKLLAQLTPQQLRERGRSEDLELAFLQLIRDQEVAK
ncbi:ABC-2 type transport system ATP-binding protein [Psychromicrobium silvestre]|uniref:ABC-2 type transport system ATP-binding protein n=1 Tax=Psychromicrobium silvestre TaxID=1645614 RepID=A0A7Y9S9Y1_9MICC|nr:ABC transporter ATP-binding protein [Psychromicrobium silvestre]NYE96697.1 ABC-2 type transport system ATP-binding protein [Psychromicrobium silvestre]